jgi:TolB-like protein/Flp pilus assembly protein TadD
MMAPVGSGAYEFGSFTLDLARRGLFRGEERISLTPKSFDALCVLVEQAGAAVDKTTLLTEVWSDVAVEENSLAKAISEIRKALGEQSAAPRFVATLPGHGYRFIASVKRVGMAPQPRRVAVMPFASRASGDADEYLAVGLADALITRLSRLHQIIVRPTRAILSFARGNQDAVAAGRQLEVDCVLDGVVRREGDRVRVTVQLINVSTGTVAWADTFDETFTGLFTLEDVISERVVAGLALVLTGEERQALSKQHTKNPEAYRWYLKGRFHLTRRTAGDCERAIESFQRVIAADPDDALAYSGIADAYVFLGIQALVMRGLAPAETFPRAKTAVAQAFRIDDRVAEAYTSQAQIGLLYDWDSTAAEQGHLRSLMLDPHGASGHHAYAMTLTFLGRHEEAMTEMQRARALDPLSPIINTNLGRLLFHARHYEDAVAQLERTIQANPDFIVAHYRLGLAFEATRRYEDAMREFATAQGLSRQAPAPTAALANVLAITGRREDAERTLESLVVAAQREYVAAPCIAEICLALGDLDRAFKWLERGVVERSSMLVTLQVNPRYDGLRQDHRFERLVESVGLWRT